MASARSPGPASAVSVRPSHEASIAPNFTHHAPSTPAVASRVMPAKDTFTFAPGSALPHTGTSRPRCSTTRSVNGTPSSTLASSASAPSAASTAAFAVVFIVFLFSGCFPAGGVLPANAS